MIKKVLIVEDEFLAQNMLQKNLKDLKVEVVKICDTISSTIAYLKEAPELDLIFLDIELGDGLSFEIFKDIEQPCPIIFTTAYDQYALKAFELHSIDYLLKPIKKVALENALQKYEQRKHASSQVSVNLESLIKELSGGAYKDSFLLERLGAWYPVESKDIVCIFIEDAVLKVLAKDGKRYIGDKSLEEFESFLNPKLFFKANRQNIIHKKFVHKIHKYFNGKLLVELDAAIQDPIHISKRKATEFREWLDN
ncbi:MAG: LytR/AlgR family response regulator transcription factor [Flavobacteriaceae bacterium]